MAATLSHKVQKKYLMTKSLKLLSSAIFACLLILPGLSSADDIKPSDVIPVINKEVYSNVVVLNGLEDTEVVRYYRENEGEQGWSRMVAYQYDYSDGSEATPKKTVTDLVASLKNSDPTFRYQLSGDPEGRVYLLDYIIYPPNRQFFQLNVLRIEEVADTDGVVIVKFSVRLPNLANLNQEQAKQIKMVRDLLLLQISQYDMPQVKKLMTSMRAAKAQ